MDTTSPFDLDDAAIEQYIMDDLNGVSSLDRSNGVLDFVDPDGPEGEDQTSLVKRYLYGNHVDQLLSEENVNELANAATRVFWPLVDHQQTVRDLYLNDATSTEHFEYNSVGLVSSGDTSLTRYLFTSRELDSTTDLQYSRSRWYVPSSGIWLNEDAIRFLGGDLNLYTYVGNAVTINNDPSGYKTIGWNIVGSIGYIINVEVSIDVHIWDSKNGWQLTIGPTFAGGVGLMGGASLSTGPLITNAQSTTQLTGWSQQVQVSGALAYGGSAAYLWGKNYKGANITGGIGGQAGIGYYLAWSSYWSTVFGQSQVIPTINSGSFESGSTPIYQQGS